MRCAKRACGTRRSGDALVTRALASTWHPLEVGLRGRLETQLGHDFARVRVHAGSAAAAAADHLDAEAFTVGRDVVLGSGIAAAGTGASRGVMAHELSHVMQHDRAGGESAVIHRKPKPPAKPSRKKPPAKPAAAAPEADESGRVKWRVYYATEREAAGKRKMVTDLGLAADPVFKEKAGWTFFYVPLSEDEAKAELANQTVTRGDKYTLVVDHSTKANSYYVRATLKCPEAIPAKQGFKTWAKCFPTRKAASALVTQLTKAHVIAEVHELDPKQFGVYYKPMSEAEASKLGTESVKRRPGFAEGMFDVVTSKRADLDSFTYGVTTKCPTGFTDLGNFSITGYAIAQERNFPATPTVKDPCGLTGTFRETFLTQTGKSPRGVKMQGSGKAMDGRFIHYKGREHGKDCFEVARCALIPGNKCATVGQTVAVDKSVIALGTELLIEDIGPRVAEDVGGKITGQDIDVYYGDTMSVQDANKLTFPNRKVCRKV